MTFDDELPRRRWPTVSVAALALLAAGAAGWLWLAGRFTVVAPAIGAAAFAAACGGGLLAAVLALFDRGWRRPAGVVAGVAVAAVAVVFAWRLAAPLDATATVSPGRAVVAPAPAKLRVVQLNVLHGYPARRRLDRRTDDLAFALRELTPDVIVLQESWRYRDRGDLARRLADELGYWSAYAAANGSLRLLGFEEGSAILSRYPIRAAERLELRPRAVPFDRRVALRVELDLGDGRTETIVGTHLTPVSSPVAASQAAHLLQQLDGERPLLVAGDLNEELASPTLASFEAASYRTLVSDGIDHVLGPDGENGWRLLWGEVALPTALGLSDHPGLLVELASLRPPAAGRWHVDWSEPVPARLGFDVKRLEGAADRIGSLDGVTALVVLRHGRLALERYFRGGGPDRLHNMKSASKSVLSALVGIAVAEGYLGLDTPVTDILGWKDEDGEGARDGITVGHLLTMSSGLESTSFGNYGAWVSSRNWVADALKRPIEAAPGQRFSYSTGDTHLLSAVLTEATGLSSLDFAREHLFAPLGIDRVSWDRDPQGIYLGGNNLSLTPRGMARFGQLYLDRGRWGDRQIVPWEWVDASTQPRATSRWSGRGYGYLWWLRPADERGAYNASGHGGQYIYVSPLWDLVVVVNSTEPSKGRQWRRDLFGEIRDGIGGSLPTYPPTVAAGY